MFKLNFYNPTYLIVLSLLNFSTNAQENAIASYTADYPDAVKYLFSLKTTGESADVSSEIILNKDVGSFKLREGKLYQCDDYKGIPYALVFVGKGDFSFTPPTEIERKQLYRFYEKESFEMEFKELFVLFDDNTFEELTTGLNFQKTNTSDVDREIKNYTEYFEKYDFSDSRSDFLRSLMMEGKNGYFYAQIQETKFDPVFFQINPFDDEEIHFMRRTNYGAEKYCETVNQFKAKDQTFQTYFKQKPNKYFLDLISYKIESTIASDLDFSTKCIIDFKSVEKEQEWIMFYLFKDLYVDSVRWEDNTAAKYTNYEKGYELWIKCKNEFLDGNQHSLTVYYHGDLLEKDNLGWIELKSSIFWYPRFDNHEKAVVGLIFHYPSKYELISVGELINRVEKDEVVTTTWFCNIPSRNFSFSIGNFNKYEVKNERISDVNVYISEYGHQQISSYLAKYGILSMSDASEFIAQDVSNSIKLFTELFGPPPFKSVSVTEIPYLRGEAFPGLLHLSWVTVQTNFEGEEEIFRAHEAAHQWWGIGVDFDSYHDQWLSEGFAQYCGLWYLQAAKNDNELFFDILNSWKDDIINVRHYIFGSGQEAGPVWLGYRTSSSNTAGDYNLIIYKKGAWILHMLRAMLLNLNNMNEDRMKNMIRDFYKTYENKSATTIDFKKIVDKHFGEDMDWFFNQYVYETYIPIYHVAYKSERTGEGKTIITIRVRQEEVPENFKMYVPIKLVLEGDRIGRIRIEVKGKETIYSTPPIDGELDELVYNDLESVLCKVEYEDWD